jgi:hypothetical protein
LDKVLDQIVHLSSVTPEMRHPKKTKVTPQKTEEKSISGRF